MLAALLRCLEAPERVTRRRASRLLAEAKPARVRPLLLELLAEATTADRHRASAVRLLTLLSPQGEPALEPLLLDPSPRVRRAAATPATPVHALQRALDDEDAGVVSSALAALVERESTPDAGALRRALARHGDALGAARRLLAAGDPTAAWVAEAAAAGDAGALDYLAFGSDAPEVWQALTAGTARVAAVWARARAGHLDPLWATDPDPRIRGAVARALPSGHALLVTLSRDPEPEVAWLAREAEAGAYDPAHHAARGARHARLDAPSARPPYGLSAEDSTAAPPRVAEPR